MFLKEDGMMGAAPTNNTGSTTTTAGLSAQSPASGPRAGNTYPLKKPKKYKEFKKQTIKEDVYDQLYKVKLTQKPCSIKLSNSGEVLISPEAATFLLAVIDNSDPSRQKYLRELINKSVVGFTLLLQKFHKKR